MPGVLTVPPVMLEIKALAMKSASVRDLKTHTSELLLQAARETVVITSRGRPVAYLVGFQPGTAAARAQVPRENTGKNACATV